MRDASGGEPLGRLVEEVGQAEQTKRGGTGEEREKEGMRGGWPYRLNALVPSDKGARSRSVAGQSVSVRLECPSSPNLPPLRRRRRSGEGPEVCSSSVHLSAANRGVCIAEGSWLLARCAYSDGLQRKRCTCLCRGRCPAVRPSDNKGAQDAAQPVSALRLAMLTG
jgi:hypothetical protein